MDPHVINLSGIQGFCTHLHSRSKEVVELLWFYGGGKSAPGSCLYWTAAIHKEVQCFRLHNLKAQIEPWSRFMVLAKFESPASTVWFAQSLCDEETYVIGWILCRRFIGVVELITVWCLLQTNDHVPCLPMSPVIGDKLNKGQNISSHFIKYEMSMIEGHIEPTVIFPCPY